MSAQHELCQRRLQSVYQFLNLFLAQWFEQASGDGCQASENLGFSLPIHFRSESGASLHRCTLIERAARVQCDPTPQLDRRGGFALEKGLLDSACPFVFAVDPSHRDRA